MVETILACGGSIGDRLFGQEAGFLGKKQFLGKARPG
jgi:hypothetical protein